MARAPNDTIGVLGGGGFLGSHLVRALLAETGHRVIAVDRQVERLALAHPRLEVRRADLADDGLVAAMVEGCDLIVSTTALCNPALYNTEPIAVIEGSYDHLVPLVDRCAEAGRFLLHLSTCEVYGRGAGDAPMCEDDTPLTFGPVQRERWSYACAKQLLERRIWARGVHHGLPFTIVRPFNVIGPWMDFLPGVDGEGIPRVLACFVRALLYGEPLQLVDGGAQRRSFLQVDEFVDGLLRIIARREACRGAVINLGHPGNDVSIAELAAQLARLGEQRGQGPVELRTVSARRFYGEGYDDVARRVPDIGRARALLDWQPRVSLAAMLPAILDDYLQRYGRRAAAGAEPG